MAVKIKGLTLRRLAAVIADRLRSDGIEVVLSGGACVSIYTRNKYLSHDLDFVLSESIGRKRLKAALAPLGFTEQGRYFRHPETPYIIDFLMPPLSVGEEPVREISDLRIRGKSLRLLSPTDCVKDRLAAFYHWRDRPSFEQARMVCAAAAVDLEEVRRWSAAEGKAAEFALFGKSLASR